MAKSAAQRMREWRQRHLEKARKRDRVRKRERYAAGWRDDPVKKRAWKIVSTALKNGSLQKQPCEVCGAPAEAHHDDYSKPLEVRWLCRIHHSEHHKDAR